MANEIQQSVHEAAEQLRFALGTKSPSGSPQVSGATALREAISREGDPAAVAQLEADVVEFARWTTRLVQVLGDLTGSVAHRELVDVLQPVVTRLEALNDA